MQDIQLPPASKIMEISAVELPKHNGWTIQVEDEISAIGAVIGSWFAGTRSMTATSGPGIISFNE